MKPTEARLDHIEGTLKQIVLMQSKIAHHHTLQALNLTTALTVALEEIARQVGADINVLILVLEKHCDLERGRDPKVDLSLVDAMLAHLRAPAR